MSAAPEISVIVPTKDRARSLENVIPSYLMQPELAELIIVDDGSTDRTAETLARLSEQDRRIRVVRHTSHRGTAAAKNSGIELVRYGLVFFGEDDLELTPGYLGTLLAHRDRSGADLISGRTVWRFASESAEAALARNAASGRTAVNRKTIALDQNVALPDDTNELLLSSTMLGSTELVKRLWFDERYRGNAWREESDFQLRAIAAGARLVACPHAISFNYMLTNDRGGAHHAVGVRRIYWMVRNTALFVRANHQIIARDFEIGNRHAYLARFAAATVWREMLLPRAVAAKRSIGHVARGRGAL